MQRGQEINREELSTGTSTMSNQRSRKRSSEEIYYSTSEELEMLAKQTGQVPTKRRREEEKGSYAKQAGQVPTKRRREEEKGSYAKQAGQVPTKRRREEEEKGSSDEQTGQTPRKRSRCYTASEDLQSCAERKGEKRRWSQDTECESHLRKRRRSGGGAERVAAPTGHKETNLTLESFIFHKILGSGAFGTVALATHIDSGVLVAVKIVEKFHVAAYGKNFALCERRSLERVGGSHYCTHAYATFQTKNQLFYVMEYLSGGDLVDKAGKCDITTLRLTAAELVCGLEFINSTDVVHQDLKLDNVLIDSTGHIKIADFGIASVYTPEREMPFDPAIDYYWLGGTLRDLALGAGSTLSDLDNTMNCLRPPYLVDTDPDFMDLLKKLQCKSEKLHKKTIRNIRNHPFFRGINWEEVEARETRPPFNVRRKGLRHITRQKITLDDLLDDEDIPDEMQMLFDGFSFESDKWRAMKKLN